MRVILIKKKNYEVSTHSLNLSSFARDLFSSVQGNRGFSGALELSRVPLPQLRIVLIPRPRCKPSLTPILEVSAHFFPSHPGKTPRGIPGFDIPGGGV